MQTIYRQKFTKSLVVRWVLSSPWDDNFQTELKVIRKIKGKTKEYRMGRAQLWSYTKVNDKSGIKISLYGTPLSSKKPAKVWKKRNCAYISCDNQ